MTKEEQVKIASTRFRSLVKADIHNQKQISILTGVCASTICKFYNGTIIPKRKNLYKLAGHYNVNPYWLAGLEDDRRVPKCEEEKKNRNEEQQVELLADILPEPPKEEPKPNYRAIVVDGNNTIIYDGSVDALLLGALDKFLRKDF